MFVVAEFGICRDLTKWLQIAHSLDRPAMLYSKLNNI